VEHQDHLELREQVDLQVVREQVVLQVQVGQRELVVVQVHLEQEEHLEHQEQADHQVIDIRRHQVTV